jgi:diadenosine tetraphosphate (Ap4A) HIT family hydrolase
MESPLLDKTRWVSENQSASALRDLYPVSPGHTLIVPKRFVSSILELSDQELLDCWHLLKDETERLRASLHPDGFNVGVNIGEAAGQTIEQAHIHLIPRFRGDVESPRGGVRGVVPGKAGY